MSKKFVNDVIEALKANPRKVLAGHGISGAMLNKIKDRDDIFKYLGVTLEKLKTFKRGALGLKKSPGLMIKVYRNFAELNTKARLDIDNFIAGLSPEDAANFKNDDNIVTVVFDYKDCELNEVEDRAAFGFSKMVEFKKVVTKEYKIPNVGYVVIAFAPSVLRTVESKKAERVASKSARENHRENKPAKIKAALAKNKKRAKEIKADYNKKIADNNQKIKQLRNQQQRLKIENQQISNAGQDVLKKKFKDARTAELKAKLDAAVKAAENYVAMLEGSTGKKRLSIQSMLSKKNKEIRILRAKLGTYDRLGPAAIAKKGEMLKKVQEQIQNLIAKGESYSASLEKALNSINARPAQKQIIKQEVINQVAEGLPMQYAVQTALQNNVQVGNPVLDNEIESYANKVIEENPGLLTGEVDINKWNAKRRNYQLQRFGAYELTPEDVNRVYEVIENRINNEVIDDVDDVIVDEIDPVVQQILDVDNEEKIDFQDVVNALEVEAPIAKRKRRTKKEMEIARKLAARAKREKEKAKREKLRALKAAKKAKLEAKRAKAAAKKNPVVEAEIDPVVQQILDNSYMAANNVDPVVQQILDMDDTFVNPDNQVVPDLNEQPIGSVDFAELLNLI